MPEKRIVARQKKRLPLKFGPETPTRVAFTEDLTIKGLFVRTVTPPPPGTRIVIELTLPENGVVVIEGITRWRKTVPPQVMHLAKKTGMGVKILKFVSGEDCYRRFVAGGGEGMQRVRAT